MIDDEPQGPTRPHVGQPELSSSAADMPQRSCERDPKRHSNEIPETRLDCTATFSGNLKNLAAAYVLKKRRRELLGGSLGTETSTTEDHCVFR